VSACHCARSVTVGLLALVGCDRVFALDNVRLVADAAIPDAATVCEHDAPFVTAEQVPGLATAAGEIDVWLSPDEAWGFVTLAGAQQTSKLHYLSRLEDGSYSIGTELTEINARSTTVGNPTPRGSYLYYDAFYGATTRFDIEVAYSPAPGAAYGNSMAVVELNIGAGVDDYSPMVNHDGSRIYWTSSRSGEYEVWSAEWTGTRWGPAQLVYATAQRYERYLVPSTDDLALYLGSSTVVVGGYELRVVTRETPTAMFDQPRLLTLPMTVTSTTPAWLSEDRCRIYVAAAGDIWVATRVP